MRYELCQDNSFHPFLPILLRRNDDILKLLQQESFEMLQRGY